jgi:hypothetical protein
MRCRVRRISSARARSARSIPSTSSANRSGPAASMSLIRASGTPAAARVLIFMSWIACPAS